MNTRILVLGLLFLLFPGTVFAKIVQSNKPVSGTISWYGKHEQGRKMANGQRFDRNALTAASRTLPLGTRLRVVNEHNGLSVDVEVTDRGPVSKKRILDLSEEAARKLECISSGLCKVSITYLREELDVSNDPRNSAFK
jgi:rare lipoprotein A